MGNFVSEQLREIEHEIDNFYLNNSLVKMPFGKAVWFVMAAYEDIFFMLKSKGEYSPAQLAAAADNIVVQLQHPLLWLWKSCPKGGRPPKLYDSFAYEEAHKLLQLAQNYDQFYVAYTFASHGWCNLSVDENFIVAKNPFLEDLRYEAYGRLIQQRFDKLSDIQATDILERLERSISTSGEGFTYKWGRRLLTDTISFLEPVFETIFELPSHWKFDKYSLTEFRSISKFLVARSFLHILARNLAVGTGIKGLGHQDSLIVEKRERLAWYIMKYGNVSSSVANSFIDDFTFGEREIRKPDPAIQPLIKANSDDFILMPSLFTTSSMERNFVVLINKLPRTRKIYSHLVNEKENAMRQKIIDGVDISGFSYWHGKISKNSSLPDIDLALISESERVIIIAELKWFLAPAEPREVIEKSEEIERGLSQLTLLKDAFLQDPVSFYRAMNLESPYDVLFLVVSENYIGTCINQNPEIPVIQRKHFVLKLNEFGSFRQAIQWLTKREYLPVENVHFSSREATSTIGQWNIKWYIIDPLIDDVFE